MSILMTRQNMLPINGQPTLTLIPLWDLMNHAHGQVNEAHAERPEKNLTPLSLAREARITMTRQGPSTTLLFVTLQSAIRSEGASCYPLLAY